jgi:hypothetical protein
MLAPVAPEFGLMPVSVGGGGLIVKVAGALVPVEVVTVTLVVPGGALPVMEKVAVICVALTTFTLLTAMLGLPTLIVAPVTKPEPAMLTGTTAPGPPLVGLMELIAGGGGGFTVNGPLRLKVPSEAEIVDVVAVTTGTVAMLKLPSVVPVGSVTPDGTEATLGTVLDRETGKLAGAGAFKVMKPAPLFPPTTEPWSESRVILTGATVKVAEPLPPAELAEIVTGVAVLTGTVVIVKLARVDPAGIVTEAGTAASAGAELNNEIAVPPAGAGAGSTTIFAIEVLPPLMVDGTSVTVKAWTADCGVSIFCDR